MILFEKFRSPAAAALAALAACASGCYSERITSGFKNLPDAEEIADSDAVLEANGRDERSKAERERELRAIAAEGDAVYRINAGDLIEVRVYGHNDIGIKTKVSPDGCIGMVFLGQVKVGGCTIAEACETIQKGLAPYVKHPVVGITVAEVSSEAITISGACAKPGSYIISDSTRIADAYALAGGSAVRLFNGADVDVADLEHSFVVRDGKVLPVDMSLAVAGDPLHNLKLRKGDYIFVAQAMQSSITICGEVGKPHRRFYEKGMGLIEELTDAGWMKETHWSHVIIIRNGLSNPEMFKVDVDGILAGRCRNVMLKPNDIIYVPHDNLSEYNVFIRKLLPTAQLINLLSRGAAVYSN